MIIVGLGNPGPEYNHTRHNIGFVVAEKLVKQLDGTDWVRDRDVLVSKVGNHWIIKPQQYMNHSGPALRDWLAYKNIQTDPAGLHAQLIVIHDELDFPLGTVKLQRDRSSAGHNGVQSIIDAFSTKDFRRLRFGIGNNKDFGIPAEAYVLQTFPQNEVILVEPAITEAVRLLSSSCEPGK